MNPEQLETFRKAILHVLEDHASDRFGLSVPATQIFLGRWGFRTARREELNMELTYLEDKKLAAPVGRTLSPENRCWRITAEGRDFLATNE